jgi:Ca2+-binding RTX toxin-like protein
MSFLTRGNRRGRRGVALVVAGALMAFQALAIVMAPAASAAVTCSFAGGVITINVGVDEAVEVGQDSSSGTIKIAANGGAFLDCAPVAPIATTTAINITGAIGDEFVGIEMWDLDTDDLVSWGTVNWTINLGSDAFDDDFLYIDGFFVDDGDMDVVYGASGIDLNGDDDLDITLAGVEDNETDGGDGDDTVSGAGSTATGAAFPTAITDLDGFLGDDTLTGGASQDTIFGGAGDDTVAGGLGDDSLDGGADTGVTTDCSATGGDWVDYSGSATAVTVNLTAGNATGEGLDTISTVENITGSAQADTLTGEGGDNQIAPGAGDDKVDGSGGIDTVDYSDATSAVTVDFSANTATGGSGNDTLTSIENAHGSDFDDTFVDQTDQDNVACGGGGNDLFNQGASASSGEGDILDGEGGTDTVDYGARTSDLNVTLNGPANMACGPGVTSGESAEADCIHTTENANLGTGDDTFKGNEFNNVVKPGGGQNVLDGEGGSDTLDYSNYTAGVTVNMAGGSTAGDSAVDFENAKGSPQKDNITGNELSNTLKAGKGNDNVKGGAGDDTVRGGPGKDTLRGGTGDDDLFGGAGNDTLNGGAGTDLCKGGKGKDKKRGCELGGKG